MPFDPGPIVAAARAALPPAMWDHVTTGSWSEVTAREAAAAWQGLRFRPRVLRGVGEPVIEARLLGREVATPVGIAPTSLQRLAHPEGELAMAAGARDAGCVNVVSSNAGHRFAEIGARAGTWWLQLYLPPERSAALPVIEVARAAGAAALVLTVDTPEPGPKPRPDDEAWEGLDLSWFRCNFAEPGTLRWAGDLRPEDVGWLAEQSGLPVVVKGVLRGDDAHACVDAGAAAVWVSNHGGRQLDRAIPTALALPEVVEAVDRRAEVYVDGGISSGLDALAAWAMGADAVFLGRLPLFALAAGGRDGVAQLVRELTDDVVRVMRLAGARTLSDIGGDLLVGASESG